MPLITCLFRVGFTPGRFIGISGSIAFHSSSSSQYRFDIPDVLMQEPDVLNRTRPSRVKG